MDKYINAEEVEIYSAMANPEFDKWTVENTGFKRSGIDFRMPISIHTKPYMHPFWHVMCVRYSQPGSGGPIPVQFVAGLKD